MFLPPFIMSSGKKICILFGTFGGKLYLCGRKASKEVKIARFVTCLLPAYSTSRAISLKINNLENYEDICSRYELYPAQ